MSQPLFYRCCEVGAKSSDVNACWVCGSENFEKAIDLDVDRVYESYYRFIYNGRIQGADGDPPW